MKSGADNSTGMPAEEVQQGLFPAGISKSF